MRPTTTIGRCVTAMFVTGVALGVRCEDAKQPKAGHATRDGSTAPRLSKLEMPRPWYEVERDVDALGRLALWPSRGDLSAQQWYSYCCMAEALLDLRDEDIVAVFTSYMVSSAIAEHHAVEVPIVDPAGESPASADRTEAAGMRLMVLNRMMFDIPLDTPEVPGEGGEQGLLPAGGIPMATTDGWPPSTQGLVAAPVCWRGSRPVLCASPARRGPGLYLTSVPYRPEAEFTEMARRFPRRTNIEAVLALLHEEKEREREREKEKNNER